MTVSLVVSSNGYCTVPCFCHSIITSSIIVIAALLPSQKVEYGLKCSVKLMSAIFTNTGSEIAFEITWTGLD
jgi:hypothetical protein